MRGTDKLRLLLESPHIVGIAGQDWDPENMILENKWVLAASIGKATHTHDQQYCMSVYRPGELEVLKFCGRVY